MNCVQCQRILSGKYQKKFCGKSCAAKHNNKNRSHSDQTREKIRKSLTKPPKIKKPIGGQRKPTTPDIWGDMCALSYCTKCKRVMEKTTKRLCSVCVTASAAYRTRCNFTFNIYDYPDMFDLSLIEKYGWYSPNGYGSRNKTPNLGGVSRDHLYSVSDGRKNGVDPSLLAHPANCQLILQSCNARKRKRSSITLEELHNRIKTWCG